MYFKIKIKEKEKKFDFHPFLLYRFINREATQQFRRKMPADFY